MVSQNKHASSATIFVPVVFHVVYNATVENVPDSLLIRQLDQLNKDFKRLNADTVNTPLPFKNIAAGMDIQFCFASITPSSTPTNGINRVFTNKTFFNSPPNYTTPDSLKHSSLGGADAWNTSAYLNIWIGNVLNVSGYAAPPSNMMASEDGVGVNYKTLGTANSSLPYNKFRTITHETGHFFGLKHIWGDDGGTCTGTDYMGDTPNQANFTPGSMSNTCNAFPLYDACTGAGDGIMFMNYMDYSNDGCRNMFTQNQINYMGATINCCRSGFLSNTAANCFISTSAHSYETTGNNFSFSPNPASEKIKIKAKAGFHVLKIIDVLGRPLIVVSDENTGGETEINIQQLQRGIYFICIDNFPAKTLIRE